MLVLRLEIVNNRILLQWAAAYKENVDVRIFKHVCKRDLMSDSYMVMLTSGFYKIVCFMLCLDN